MIAFTTRTAREQNVRGWHGFCLRGDVSETCCACVNVRTVWDDAALVSAWDNSLQMFKEMHGEGERGGGGGARQETARACFGLPAAENRSSRADTVRWVICILIGAATASGFLCI
jgi:heme-degrading monooxygenase HmoA